MTTALTITALPYSTDPLTLFERLRQRPGAMLLDSGRPTASGRYDILSSDPLATLSLPADGHARLSSATLAWPTAIAEGSLEQQQQWLLDQLPVCSLTTALPFVGGLMGYWSYDAGRQQLGIASRHPPATSLPLARLGLYDWCITLDHESRQAWLVASAERAEAVHRWLAAPLIESAPFALTQSFQPDLSQADYIKRFDAVQRYIRAGDCYQINLAQRLSARYTGDPWYAYRQLRAATPTPFAGFMAWEEQAVLSLSPERFIQARDGQVETRPIKGTRPRGATPDEDNHLAQQLLSSAKDRAENVMIVDLLRNDLGRVCSPGSIHVPQLCALESYPNVHHLVSVVRGQLAPGCSPLSLLTAASPGGSITGAPKIRAMQIIDELEPCQRSVYCGSLGYIDTRGSMDSSIAIRSMVADQGKLHVWGGGGLVADSQAEEEHTETLDKIRHLVAALE